MRAASTMANNPRCSGTESHDPSVVSSAAKPLEDRTMTSRRRFGDMAGCAICGQDIQWFGRGGGWRDRGNNRECVPYQHKGEIVQPKPGQKHKPR